MREMEREPTRNYKHGTRKQEEGEVKHSLLVTNYSRAKRTNKQPNAPNGHDDDDDGRVMDPFCRPIDFIKDSSLLNIKVWRSNNVPSSSKLSQGLLLYSRLITNKQQQLDVLAWALY